MAIDAEFTDKPQLFQALAMYVFEIVVGPSVYDEDVAPLTAVHVEDDGSHRYH